jgi:hypothetical protein
LSIEAIAKQFFDLCQAGEFEKVEAMWSDNVVSYEAQDMPMKECRGREAVHAKGEWFSSSNDVHSMLCAGPYLNGDQFAIRFTLDFTPKEAGAERQVVEEVGIYTVKNGKIIEERFFY